MFRLLKGLGIVLALALICGAGLPQTSQAAYPDRPVTLIVPFGAGGSSDVVARFAASFLEKKLGKTVIVKNVVGTAGIAGMTAVAEAKPDGYTIGLTAVGPMALQPTFRGTPYSIDSFEAISMVTEDPLCLYVKKSSPWNTLAEMTTEVKKNPDKYYFTYTGAGSQPHLAIVQLLNDLDIKIKGLPLKDDAEVMQSMAGDRVHLYCSLPSLLAVYDVKSLVLFNPKRLEEHPSIPTAADLGLDITFVYWQALVAPKGTPADVIKTLDNAMQAISKDPEYIAALKKMNSSSSYMNSETTLKYMKDEEQHYKETIELIKKK